ncbi:PAS domain S-box-containing protein/diguanylate cyclase (GGDEF) domain-containing protein [Persephonella hydrogeniphila]|uniref:diguanylate cyclase n=1 Tax=Persephonella hydrogeniphila TaxID=198703 RepID=A0A285NB89_9AQUI|nr:diguanylate cyclase [Persephonella hydrogeniphila]SNZ06732.1 PAS domain S-box-containing protein/diguanylate cyclase (GGDEF) domain-containing protein [Persephonella hydrogeniphila]
MDFAKKYDSNYPVIVIDRDFNIVFSNRNSRKIYGNIEGKKCYQVFNNLSSPCYKVMPYVCPIRVLKNTKNKEFTGLYHLNSCGDRYVLMNVIKDKDFFIQKHRFFAEKEFSLPDFKRVLDLLGEGIIIFDTKGIVRYTNKKFLSMFGIKKEPDFFFDKHIDKIRSLFPEEIKDIFSRQEEIPEGEEYLLHFPNRYITVKKSVLDNSFLLWSFIEKKEMDLGDEIFRVLLETTPVGIFLQCSGRFMYINPTMASILETTPGSLIGSSIFDFVHPEYRGKVAEIAKRRNSGERFTEKYVIKVVTGKNKIKWVEITSQTISFRDKNCGIGSVVDITDRKKLEEDLRNLATVDQLTGIYNRYAFERFLEREISRAERYGTKFAILMFDIDNFKQINDIYGHQVGDKVLKEIVQVIKKHIRRSDIFARWGGEEFMVLVPIKNKADAYKIAEKIRKTVENHIFENIKHLTISIGISFYKEGDSIKSLIRRADTALYEAKKTGKNKTVIAD